MLITSTTTSKSIHNEIARPCLSSNGAARPAGRSAEWPGASWLAASLPWAPRLARFGSPGRFWLALAGSMWLRAARSGCPGRSGWLALDAQGALGSPWLANDCPIDAISKKNRFAFRRSCFDAACFVRSGTFLHASNLVINIPSWSYPDAAAAAASAVCIYYVVIEGRFVPLHKYQ